MPLASSVGWLGCRRVESRPGKPDRIVETRHDANLARHGDQILVAHQLGDGRRHFRCEAGRDRAERLLRRFIGQQPVAKCADRQGAHRRERRCVVRIVNEARDFVVFVRHERVVPRNVASGTSASAMRAATRSSPDLRRKSRQPIAGAIRRRARQQRLQIVEDVAVSCRSSAVGHRSSVRADDWRKPRRSARLAK